MPTVLEYKLTRLFFLAMVLLLSCNGQKATAEREIEILTGKVVAIADGDTFTLLTDGNVQKKIRLHGIDCPEKKQPFGNRSKNELSRLVFGKQVKVDYKSMDRYKRIVGIVYCGDINVNEAMLQNGYAWHFKRYDQNPVWAEFEIVAKKQKIGLWIEENAVAPWEWRNNK